MDVPGAQIIENFNPRSPCGERHAGHTHLVHGDTISIHAPRVGSDPVLHHGLQDDRISIHAPRVGSDNE